MDRIFVFLIKICPQVGSRVVCCIKDWQINIKKILTLVASLPQVPNSIPLASEALSELGSYCLLTGLIMSLLLIIKVLLFIIAATWAAPKFTEFSLVIPTACYCSSVLDIDLRPPAPRTCECDFCGGLNSGCSFYEPLLFSAAGYLPKGWII